jgi:hypothetical protein
VALEGLFISLSVAGGLEALGGWALPVIASAAKQSRVPLPLARGTADYAGRRSEGVEGMSGGEVDCFATLTRNKRLYL